jgi:AraC-like DNA-binding protein
MQYKIKYPSGALAEFIDSFWTLEIESDCHSETTERVIPNGTLQMIFHYGIPFYEKCGKKEIFQNRLILCGQKKVFSNVTAPAGSGMIGVVFKPFGVRPFFNIPVCELTDSEIPLSDVIGKSGDELEDQLYHCSCFEERIHKIEDFLLKCYFLHCRYSWGLARECVKYIQISKGLVTVRDLSLHFNTSSRNLERIFAAYIGVSPKFFIRLNRFKQAMAMAQSQKRVNLTSIALDCGYFDQSHFINESKALSGMNPSSFFANRCVLPAGSQQ